MWIEITEKEYYLDSRVKGLRVRYESSLEAVFKDEMKIFFKWLRKRYFFPIRCLIKIKDCPYFCAADENDRDSYGDFYYKKSDDRVMPEIWVAAGKDKKKDDLTRRLRRTIFVVCHELTHYFQWYFCEFDKRTDRSLDLEADKWANWLLAEYGGEESENENLKQGT